jgi:type I site-specific restriction-modification system R (restriction) subunit
MKQKKRKKQMDKEQTPEELEAENKKLQEEIEKQKQVLSVEDDAAKKAAEELKKQNEELKAQLVATRKAAVIKEMINNNIITKELAEWADKQSIESLEDYKKAAQTMRKVPQNVVKEEAPKKEIRKNGDNGVYSFYKKAPETFSHLLV